MSTSTRESPGPPVLQEVSDGLYAYVQPDGTWWINNTGLLVGPHGVTLRVGDLRTEIRHVGHPAHTTSDSIVWVLAPLGAQTIVPGHGPVAGPGLVEEVLGYLRFVLDVAARGRAAGLTPLEAARETDLGAYARWHDAERIVGNLHRACAEADGLPEGGEIDLAAALGDMVAYNGGRPLTRLA